MRSGYQPDTKSPSSRRADFDLQRRLVKLEQGGGGLPPGGDPGEILMIDANGDAVWTTPGAATGTSYVHNQGFSASTWVIDHNLGWYPNVLVEDSAGTTVEGDVVYDSTNRVTLTFSAAFAGVAYLS